MMRLPTCTVLFCTAAGVADAKIICYLYNKVVLKGVNQIMDYFKRQDNTIGEGASTDCAGLETDRPGKH